VLDLAVDRNILLKLILKEPWLCARVKSFLISPAMGFCEVMINLNILLKEINFLPSFCKLLVL
jgi:hypothetical protein